MYCFVSVCSGSYMQESNYLASISAKHLDEYTSCDWINLHGELRVPWDWLRPRRMMFTKNKSFNTVAARISWRGYRSDISLSDVDSIPTTRRQSTCDSTHLISVCILSNGARANCSSSPAVLLASVNDRTIISPFTTITRTIFGSPTCLPR